MNDDKPPSQPVHRPKAGKREQDKPP